MIKGSKKISSCRHADFSQCDPDNFKLPDCKKGHKFSGNCLDKNDCMDYKFDWGISWAEIKKRLELEGK